MIASLALRLLGTVVSASLLLAQDPAPPAPGGFRAKAGSGLEYDGGDVLGFRMLNMLQATWTFSSMDNGAADTSTFNVPRARTTLWGHVFGKNLLYKLQVDGADAGAAGGAIKEGHATWNFATGDHTVGLRMGQGKALYGFEGTGSSAGTFFAETSAATKGFAAAYSRGAWFVGSSHDNQLRWSVGAMNGDVAGGLGAGYLDRGEESANSDNELSYTAQLNFDPLGRFLDGGNEAFLQGDFRTGDKSLKGTVGVGAASGNGRSTGTGTDVESTSINLDTAWSIAGFQVMGEYFLRTDEQQGVADKEEPHGFYVQGNYILPKGADTTLQWGFGVRFSMVENDVGNNGTVDFLTGLRGIAPSASANSDATEVTVVANAFYHGHAAKTQIEYTWQDVDLGTAGDATNHILVVAFQLLF
ncbi:MAG: hypothetical protein Q7T30_02980 [Planctomycetota bacterium]|nr:hypothetical protein [Planctomycetota bacterium]